MKNIERASLFLPSRQCTTWAHKKGIKVNYSLDRTLRTANVVTIDRKTMSILLVEVISHCTWRPFGMGICLAILVVK